MGEEVRDRARTYWSQGEDETSPKNTDLTGREGGRARTTPGSLQHSGVREKRGGQPRRLRRNGHGVQGNQGVEGAEKPGDGWFSKGRVQSTMLNAAESLHKIRTEMCGGLGDMEVIW